MQERMCETCQREPAVGVVASGYVPMSSAICSPCLEVGAETYDTCVFIVAMAEGDDQTIAALQETVVAATLMRTGKTMAQFDEDVQLCRQRMSAYGEEE